jgi:predicted transcriptional regulator
MIASMFIDDTLSIYRSQRELADALQVTAAAVSAWRKRNNGKIPELYARRLHELTRGKLKFDRDQYLDS